MVPYTRRLSSSFVSGMFENRELRRTFTLKRDEVP
jgi:hypothetical protein